MASNTMATWNRRKRKHKNNGRKRKNQESRHSTRRSCVRRIPCAPASN